MTVRSPGALEARGLSWSVRGRTIVEGLSVAPPPGAMTGVLGPNGSGKSTLLRLLTGLLAPTAGAVLLDGADVHSIPRKRLARMMALVEQEATTDQNPTVREVIELGRIPHRAAWRGPRSDDDVVERVAAQTGLSARLDQRYPTLSGGERQRVHIARALAQQPRILVLDEPTNHLDIRHQLELMALVRGTDNSVIAALHDLTLAATFCDHLLVLAGGRLVAAGAPREILTADLIREVYGVDAEVAHDDRGTHVRYLTRC